MRRPTAFSSNFSLIRTGVAGALVLAISASCSDSTSPREHLQDGVQSIEIVVPDSLKRAIIAQASDNKLAPATFSADVLVGGSSAAASSAVGGYKYTLSHVPFAPEPIPSIAPAPLFDDGYLAHVPLGFDFNFYGNVYNEVNVFSNGLMMFGPAVTANTGFFRGDMIPSTAIPNNIIAFAWTDWQPNKVPGSIRYETRGEAPNRRFILQFTNVPEFGGAGLLTMQIVLTEAAADITLYANNMGITNSGNRLTQGIENMDGTAAMFDSIQNPVTGIWSPRVRNFFKVQNDAIRFAPPRPPVLTIPSNISVPTAPPAALEKSIAAAANVGSCSANVNPGVATATDDADGVVVKGVRSDNPELALEGEYQKGVTTIDWTAIDVDGMTANAKQTITVLDKENPVLSSPADITVRDEMNVGKLAVDVGSATAQDNCASVVVGGSRSDGAPLDAFYPDGITVITWTAKDESGNVSTAKQTVKVVINEAPVFTSVPVNFNVETGKGVCSAFVDVGVASATDDIDGVKVSAVRSDKLPLSAAFPKGVTTITWTALDIGGRSVNANQTVTVSDKERPVLTAPASIVADNDPGMPSAVVNVGDASVLDNCNDATVKWSRSDGAALNAPYRVGVTTIVWSAADASGNAAASAEQSITVRDREAPVVTVPASFSLPATSPSGAVVSFTASAKDNVGVVSFACSKASGVNFPAGPNSVTCTASDAAGNTRSETFVVTVIDPPTQTRSLMQYIIDLNLPNGVTNPLVNQLSAALSDGANSCKKMSDFIDMVSKKSGSISDYDIGYMTAEAQRIMKAMGCVINTTKRANTVIAAPNGPLFQSINQQ